MATGGTSISALTTLDINYMRRFVDALNDSVLSRKLCCGKDFNWEGDYLVKRVLISRHVGMTQGTDGMALPEASTPEMIQMKTYRRFFAARTEVTEGALATAKTDKKAAISTAKLTLKRLGKDVRKFQDFLFTRDGTGKFATVYAWSSPTLTVDDARGLWRDGWYTIYSSAGVEKATFQAGAVTLLPTTVSGVSRATLATTNMTTGYSYASGDYVVWGRGSSVLSSGVTYTGLDALIGTGTLQNINPTTYPEWQSLVLSNSGTPRPQAPRLMRKMLAGLKQMSGDDKMKLTVLFSNFDMLEFEELFENEVRLTPKARVAGLVAPMFHSHFGDVSPITAHLTPYGKMFFVDRREIAYAKQKELGFRPGDQGNWRVAENTLHRTADMFEIGEYMIENRKKCGKITDLDQELVVMH